MDTEPLLESDLLLSDFNLGNSPVAAPAEVAPKKPESKKQTRITIIGCAIAGAVFLFMHFFPNGLHVERINNPYTKLGVTEARITDVASEFKRRSPRLVELMKEYGDECRKSVCPTSLNARKEAIIREDWPGIFARLRIKYDWHPAMIEKSYSYFQVGDIVDEYKDLAPIMCVPKLSFNYTKMSGPYLLFEKFVCIPPEAPFPPG